MAKKKLRNKGYAAKRARGEMMYGPGCCAHDRTITQSDRDRFAAMRRENDRPQYAAGSRLPHDPTWDR